jgi:hypothetical protein
VFHIVLWGNNCFLILEIPEKTPSSPRSNFFSLPPKKVGKVLRNNSTLLYNKCIGIDNHNEDDKMTCALQILQDAYNANTDGHDYSGLADRGFKF